MQVQVELVTHQLPLNREVVLGSAGGPRVITGVFERTGEREQRQSDGAGVVS